MVKIQEIALTKILKLELPQFVKKVTACLEKHNLEVLKLQDAYEMLADQRSKMALLRAPYGKHILTPQIHQLHLKRLKYAAAITTQINFIRKMDMEDTRDLVKLAHPFVKLHLYYLRQNNQFVIDQIITVFFDQLNKSPDILNALETLGFKFYLDQLKNANDKHFKLCNERSKDISQRPKIDSKAVQKEAQFVLRSLFEQINFYQFTYKEIDYSPLISEINVQITRLSELIHTRETCNKTRTQKTKTKVEEAQLKKVDIELNSQNKSIQIATNNDSPIDEANNDIVLSVAQKPPSQSAPLQNLIEILKTS